MDGQNETSEITPNENLDPNVKEYTYGDGIVRERKVKVDKDYANFVQLEYDTPNGSVVLNDLLPDGWRIYHSKYGGLEINRFIHADDRTTGFLRYTDNFTVPSRKGNEVNMEDDSSLFGRAGSLLVLLHEVGHARTEVSLDTQHRNNRLRKNSAFDKPPYEPWAKYVISDERQAWAFAFRSLRELRKKGIDLEPELKTNSDLIRFAHSFLITYEQRIVDDRESEEWKSRLDGVFSEETDYGVSDIVRNAIRPKKVK